MPKNIEFRANGTVPARHLMFVERANAHATVAIFGPTVQARQGRKKMKGLNAQGARRNSKARRRRVRVASRSPTIDLSISG
jgi:hypothetical protein